MHNGVYSRSKASSRLYCTCVYAHAYTHTHIYIYRPSVINKVYYIIVGEIIEAYRDLVMHTIKSLNQQCWHFRTLQQSTWWIKKWKVSFSFLSTSGLVYPYIINHINERNVRYDVSFIFVSAIIYRSIVRYLFQSEAVVPYFRNANLTGSFQCGNWNNWFSPAI